MIVDNVFAAICFQLMVLKDITGKPMDSEAAETLLMMIAAHESGGFKHTKQIKGPAVSYWQIEPPTHLHVLKYVERKMPDISQYMWELCNWDGETGLEDNYHYAICVARLKLWTVPEPLPDADDLEGLAKYAKKYWNTHLGKATWQDYLEAYKRYVIKE